MHLLLPGRQVSVPLNFHCHGERREATVLGIHIHGDSSQSVKPLQMALETRGATDIIQSSKNLEHSGKCKRAHFNTQAFMGTEAKVGVQTHITVQTDLVGIGERNRITACNNLYFVLC